MTAWVDPQYLSVQSSPLCLHSSWSRWKSRQATTTAPRPSSRSEPYSRLELARGQSLGRAERACPTSSMTSPRGEAVLDWSLAS